MSDVNQTKEIDMACLNKEVIFQINIPFFAIRDDKIGLKHEEL